MLLVSTASGTRTVWEQRGASGFNWKLARQQIHDLEDEFTLTVQLLASVTSGLLVSIDQLVVTDGTCPPQTS